MALHRDVLWIGRQWAVTGHGMQLIDQRLMGAFDIEVAHLWDDDLIARMHAKAWLNTADFDTGLAVARARHKPPETGAVPAVATIPATEPIATAPPPPEPTLSIEPPQIAPAPPPAPSPPLPPAESATQPRPDMQMKIDGGAKFARPWRARMKKT